ncbi:MAG TPA: FTR1 family protein, partial [Anaerolineaceae bacterium]
EALHGFRAAPLTPQEQARRAGQLLRYLSLIPLEYGRGVKNNQVLHDFEIQEAITFHAGAAAALADLETMLAERDPAAAALAQQTLAALGKDLEDTAQRRGVAPVDAIDQQARAIHDSLLGVIPAEWLEESSAGDFDVIAAMLDQMEAALSNHDYAAAEAARLEAYAIMEVGPEARLLAFAPQMKVTLEDLFWNGQGEHPGLAYLIKRQRPHSEIQATRAQLDQTLAEAETILKAGSAPAAVATNAGMIVFREGLEAVIILASLMSSLKRKEEVKYRKPMWLGALLAVAATVLTWVLAHDVVQSLARYGEKLEAVVSAIAIIVLLVIMNWFFHKVYWTEWIAAFHARKRRIISGEAGLLLGLVALGFTSIYREGFETVLFLQALVLESNVGVVLMGVAAALTAVCLVGFITFRLQVNLPYKKMLVVTGILIGVVLLQMVGKTVHVFQVVGWLPISPIAGLTAPYWLGMWFGVYATWQGLALQIAAAAFVIGSYYLAEWITHRRSKSNRAVRRAKMRETSA